jgi:hypothetical protein
MASLSLILVQVSAYSAIQLTSISTASYNIEVFENQMPILIMDRISQKLRMPRFDAKFVPN